MGVRLRISLGVVAVLLAAGAGTGVAYACLDPALALRETSVGPGDRVSFTISDTDQGAEYQIHVNNQVVASGTDTDGTTGVSGSFVMPDLGADQRKLTIVGKVKHKGAETDAGSGVPHRECDWCTPTAGITYAPPAAAPAPTGSTTPQPAQQQSSSAAAGASGAPPSAPAGGPVAGPSGPAAAAPSDLPQDQGAGKPSASRTGAAERQGVTETARSSESGANQGSPARIVSSPDAGDAATPAAPASTSPGGRPAAPATVASRTGLTALPVLGVSERLTDRVARAPESAPAGAEGGPLGVAAIGVVLLLLLALGGAGAAYVRARMNRPPSDSRGPDVAIAAPVVEARDALRMLAMEAELQEMINEERARETLDPARDESRPVEPAVPA